jgi:choline dehydrogenase-like flavoprotein
MTAAQQTQVLIIGSGAGGAVTALECARAGMDVLVIEEGQAHAARDMGQAAPEALRLLYRRRGMYPVLGPTPIGYVEGCCLGGSTEVNSGFWHRTPREILLRWQAQFDLDGAGPDQLQPHFQWAEQELGVGLWGGADPARPWPVSTRLLADGIQAMGWTAKEVPRAAPGCKSTNRCASGCPTGAKAGMSTTLIPRARAAGARFLTGCRARLILKKGKRVTGALVAVRRSATAEELVRIDADHVFVCAGATETPALLRRSGIKYHVGDSLRLHPMLKVAARFPGKVDAQHSVLPLLQVSEFGPDISLGGGYFSDGHLAMLLSENWPQLRDRMAQRDQMASFYVAVRGTGKGAVRPGTLGRDKTRVSYRLSHADLHNLNRGLSRLALLLLAAGAEEVYPAIHGLPVIDNELDALRPLDAPLPASRFSLATVHAFSSCPMGERRNRCAADSFGRVYGHDNLHINDASMLPDSPGVNPQGTIMALARRNALHFTSAS